MALQVSEYAQRFNLSASLAASITRLSAWVSSAILLAITAALSPHLVSTTTEQSNSLLPLSEALAQAKWPLTAVCAAAAVALVVSVPVSAKLASKSLSQGPQRSQVQPSTVQSSPATAGAKTAVLPAALSAVPSSSDAVKGTSQAMPEAVSSSEVASSTAGPQPFQQPQQGASAGLAGAFTDQQEDEDNGVSETSDRPEGPELEPSEEAISSSAMMPDSEAPHNKGGPDVGTSGIGLASNVQDTPTTDQDNQSSEQGSRRSSHLRASSDAAQQTDQGSERSSNFFRDVSTDCIHGHRLKARQIRPPVVINRGRRLSYRPELPVRTRCNVKSLQTFSHLRQRVFQRQCILA